MADVPSGLLTEEQSNLMVKVINTESESIPITSKMLDQIATMLTSHPSVNTNPRASDIASLSGNLNAVIPAGFLLLHNDIVGLSESKSTTGSEEASTIDFLSLLKPVFIGAGAAVVAAGLVKGLFGGVSDRTTNHIQGLVDDLNEGLKAEDLANDPQIKAAQRIGFIAYLEAYFLQQAASMTVEGVATSIGVGAGSAVKSFFTTLFGKESKSEKTPNKLQTLVESLIDGIQVKDYKEDAAISAALKSGIIAYMSMYFLAQASSATLDIIGTGAGTAAAGAIKSFVSGLFGKSNADKSYTKVQTIVDDIIAVQTSDSYKGDAAVGVAVKAGIIAYLEAYFLAQAASMTMDTIGTGTGTAAAGTIKSFVTGLFGKSNDDKSYTKVQTIVDDIIQAQTSELYKNDTAVSAAVKVGIISYMEAYFLAQAASMTMDTIGTGVGTAAGDAISSFVGSLFKRKNDEKSYDKIQTIVDAVIQAQTADTYKGDSDVADAVKEGVIGYMKTYFAAQAAASALNTTVTAAAGSAGAAVRNFFSGLFGKKSKEEDTTGIDKLSKIIDSVMTSINPDEVAKSTEIQNARTKGIESYIITYFNAIAEAAADKSLSESTDTKGIVGKASNWLFGSKGDSSTNTFLTKLEEITSSFSNSDIPSANEISALKKTSLLNSAKAILNAQVDSITKELDSNVNGAIPSQIFNVSTSATIDTANETAAEGVSVLNKISETLDQLSAIVAAIQAQGPDTTVIPVPAASPATADLSVSVPG